MPINDGMYCVPCPNLHGVRMQCSEHERCISCKHSPSTRIMYVHKLLAALCVKVKGHTTLLFPHMRNSETSVIFCSDSVNPDP